MNDLETIDRDAPADFGADVDFAEAGEQGAEAAFNSVEEPVIAPDDAAVELAELLAKRPAIINFLKEYITDKTPIGRHFGSLNTPSLHSIGADLVQQGLVTPKQVGAEQFSDSYEVRRHANPGDVSIAVSNLFAKLEI